MRRRLWVIVVLVVLVVPGVRWLAPVLIVNPSPSLPPGLYVRAVPGRALRVGDLIVLETPAVLKPSLPPGYEDKPLLKQVAGLAGMRVCWETASMVVFHADTPMRYPVHEALTAHRHAEGCQVLGAEEMLVTGRHPRSYDSRYVGPVARNLMRLRVWPLWTKEVS